MRAHIVEADAMTKFEQFFIKRFPIPQVDSAPAFAVTLSSSGQTSVEITDLMQTDKFKEELVAMKAISAELIQAKK